MTVSGHMLRALRHAETNLADYLSDVDGWKSLYIDYEPPTVLRLWRTIDGGGHRLYLHRILPCETALFHPHPWPSAVKVLEGAYEMNVGFGAGIDPPNVASTLILRPGSAYEMIDPDSWHSVRPLQRPSISIMVTGIPWKRWSPGPPPGRTLRPLTQEEACALRADVWAIYDYAPVPFGEQGP